MQMDIIKAIYVFYPTKKFTHDTVSREISDLRNFWLHATCACTEQYSTYQIRLESWWSGLRDSCLGKCVGLVFGLGWEKEIYLRSRTKSKIFQWLKLFPYYSLLWIPDIQPKGFNLHNKHQKSNYQTLFLYSEKHNNWQKITGQKFRRGRKFRLTTATVTKMRFVGSYSQVYYATIIYTKVHSLFAIADRIAFIFVNYSRHRF